MPTSALALSSQETFLRWTWRKRQGKQKKRRTREQAAPQDSVPTTPRHQRLPGCSNKRSQDGPGAPLAAPIWARRRIRRERTGKHACRNGSLTPDLRRPKRRLLGSPPEDGTGAPRTRREDPLSRPPHPELAARALPMTDTWSTRQPPGPTTVRCVGRLGPPGTGRDSSLPVVSPVCCRGCPCSGLSSRCPLQSPTTLQSMTHAGRSGTARAP
ncbi:uncharacterized protein LOC123393986 isoform X1 [Mustela putorius furo]|uniref:Uncharacterized protein LOC123393986 isoform X1 n=1 Tax=Mustela putorius furo TaxID=9669 RepID=A0A8U0VA32_MUSPF|nr:uncharacterized protein LOC123393986 isoform X1 [Mustela putorius furo]